MKKLILLLLAIITVCTSCDKEDNEYSFRNKQYTLSEAENSGISGVVMIREIGASNAESAITIVIEGAQEETTYYLNLYNNSVSEGGDVAISLEGIPSGEITSNTYINGLDPNEEWDPTFPISYDELTEFDGHVLIRIGGNEGTVVAQTNIGSNAN